MGYVREGCSRGRSGRRRRARTGRARARELPALPRAGGGRRSGFPRRGTRARRVRGRWPPLARRRGATGGGCGPKHRLDLGPARWEGRPRYHDHGCSAAECRRGRQRDEPVRDERGIGEIRFLRKTQERQAGVLERCAECDVLRPCPRQVDVVMVRVARDRVAEGGARRPDDD